MKDPILTNQKIIDWCSKELPGHQGWWNAEGCNDFIASYEEMKKAGMPDTQIKMILSRIYHAVCNEFQ